MPHTAPPRRSAFERIYSVVVAIKGLDGLLEAVAGALLLVAPRSAGALLQTVAAELAEGATPLAHAAARSVSAAGHGAVTSAAPLALFFLVHGAVKLLTVVALLRRAVRWYPWAILALAVLLVVQVADVVRTPGVGGAALVALDVVVLAFVLVEYRHLRSNRPAEGSGTVEERVVRR